MPQIFYSNSHRASHKIRNYIRLKLGGLSFKIMFGNGKTNLWWLKLWWSFFLFATSCAFDGKLFHSAVLWITERRILISVHCRVIEPFYCAVAGDDWDPQLVVLKIGKLSFFFCCAVIYLCFERFEMLELPSMWISRLASRQMMKFQINDRSE